MRKNYTHHLDKDIMTELDARIVALNGPPCDIRIKGPVSRSRVVEYALRAFLDSPDGMALLPPVESHAGNEGS